MTRPLLFSNGHMHVGINLYGMVHDLYYPWVGFENHARANHMRHRVGVWTEEKFSWLDDGSWEFSMSYQDRAQIGHITAVNRKLDVTLEILDCVADGKNVFLRNVQLINNSERNREIKLFMHQVFQIGAALNGDTAQFLPAEPAILHFKGRRNFVISGRDQIGRPFVQHSMGLFDSEGHEGTYKDAEDGWLAMNEVEFGRVDSVIGFTNTIAPYDSMRYEYWLAAGKSQWEAMDLHREVQSGGFHELFAHTARHWHRWLGQAEKFISTLEPEFQPAFRNSALVLKSQIDDHGSIMASTDTTMLNYRRDSYAYCWPRDACYALWPLLRLGYKNELKNFFRFCRDALHPDGFLLQKFRPDKAPGSTWLPYVIRGRVIPPIQEDETAIVIFLLGQYIERNRDKELLDEMYDTLVVPTANFMATYINGATKLPHASYDLWEEKFLTSTYTVALVYAALNAASKMAEKKDRKTDAVRWQTVAEEIYNAAHKHLFNSERQCFYKGFVSDPEGKLQYDGTIDTSSIYGAFMFGLFAIDSKEMQASMETLTKTFGLKPNEPTIIQRYEYDQYYTSDPAGMGNPWFVTTLWVAEYDMQAGNLERAKKTIQWVQKQMLSTGVLSEQVDPKTFKFASVAPLTWSQAEFLSSILDFETHSKKS